MSSKMLKRLDVMIEDIEIDNVDDANFIRSVVIQKEVNPGIQFTGEQFSRLLKLDTKYTNGGMNDRFSRLKEQKRV